MKKEKRYEIGHKIVTLKRKQLCYQLVYGVNYNVKIEDEIPTANSAYYFYEDTCGYWWNVNMFKVVYPKPSVFEKVMMFFGIK